MSTEPRFLHAFAIRGWAIVPISVKAGTVILCQYRLSFLYKINKFSRFIKVNKLDFTVF